MNYVIWLFALKKNSNDYFNEIYCSIPRLHSTLKVFIDLHDLHVGVYMRVCLYVHVR